MQHLFLWQQYLVFFFFFFSGHGLVVEHFRETECGLREELEPIDENRRYDFDYQQFTILHKTKTIYPVSLKYRNSYHYFVLFYSQGDEILLKCFYGTSGNSGVTLVRQLQQLIQELL